MYIDNKADVIINDGTITGGYGASGDAGGMDIQYNAKVTLNKVHVIGNRSKWDGGGIFVGSGSILTVNGGGTVTFKADTSVNLTEKPASAFTFAETDGVFSGMPVAANMRRWKMVMSQDRKSIRIVPPGLMVIVK